MNSRSNVWVQRRRQIDTKEHKLKEELEGVSGQFESQVKRIATYALISGSVVLLGYGAYRFFSKPKPAVPPQKPARTAPRPTRLSPVKQAIIEKLVLEGIKLIGTQVALMVKRSSSEQKGDEQQDAKR